MRIKAKIKAILHRIRGCKTYKVVDEGECTISAVASLFTGVVARNVRATWWIGECKVCGREYGQIDCGSVHQKMEPNEIRRARRFAC